MKTKFWIVALLLAFGAGWASSIIYEKNQHHPLTKEDLELIWPKDPAFDPKKVHVR